MNKPNKDSLVIITNLYPLPWEPNRATFNRKQFSQLDEHYNKSVLVPVAFLSWFSHRKEIEQTEHLRFFPYFYLPKVGRRFYSVFMLFSILLHSGWWLFKKQPKIILASWAFPEAVAACWLSQLFNSRFFFKVHGSDINLHGKIPARAKQIVNAAKHATGILSVSKALAKEMIQMGIAEKKITVIYNGVDHQQFFIADAPSTQDDYILYVGNLKHDKGVIELLQGFSQISNEQPLLTLVFAGAGKEMLRLSLLAKQLDIAEKVSFLGAVAHEKLPQLIARAKVLALPSYNEGVPNVVLEAMACGTPVLATNVGGIPEVVNANSCGLLINPKSDNEVAQGLRSILAKKWDKTLIRQHSKSFTWANNKKQLIELLSL